jgi:hypothetical protein
MSDLVNYEVIEQQQQPANQPPQPQVKIVDLPGDSLDYELLYMAAASIKHVSGIVCEIGTRRGGSLRHIIDGLLSVDDINRNVVCIDPYGNIEYASGENEVIRQDYTNNMRNESLPNIYTYVQNRPINVVFFCLEDTEFFDRFATGVPFYQEYKEVVNQYAMVFFDGPHDTPSLMKELEFFYPRSPLGAQYVFDDVNLYPHQKIHDDLLAHGFELAQKGTLGRKLRYVKTTEVTNGIGS